MPKHGLKTLGLALVAALALMAFMAAAASAASLTLGDEFYSGEAGKWLINSGTEFPTGLTTVTVKGKQIGSSKFLIPSKSVEIVCAEGELTSTSASNEYENFKTATMGKGGAVSGTAVAKKCKVQEINAAGELTGKELATCTKALNGGTETVEAAGLGLLKKHEGVTYGILVPKVTSKATAEAAEALTAAYTTIKFGGTCTLPEIVTITGSAVEKVPVADTAKPVSSVDTFSAAGKALQALLGAKLKFGTNEAFIQGEGEAEIPWGAM